MAYFLGNPGLGSRFTWDVDKNKRMGWGKRMKQYMTALSYQWVDGEDGILDEQDEDLEPYFEFELPAMVNMAYNGAYGSMNCEYLPRVNPSARQARAKTSELTLRFPIRIRLSTSSLQA